MATFSKYAIRHLDRYTDAFTLSNDEVQSVRQRCVTEGRSYVPGTGEISSDAVIRNVEMVVRERPTGDAEIAAHLAAREHAA